MTQLPDADKAANAAQAQRGARALLRAASGAVVFSFVGCFGGKGGPEGSRYRDCGDVTIAPVDAAVPSDVDASDPFAVSAWRHEQQVCREQAAVNGRAGDDATADAGASDDAGRATPDTTVTADAAKDE